MQFGFSGLPRLLRKRNNFSPLTDLRSDLCSPLPGKRERFLGELHHRRSSA